MSKLPSAKDLQMKIAEIEGAKASAAARIHAAAEAEKEALLEKLRKPSGLSDDEVIETAGSIVARAGGSVVAVGYDGRLSSPGLEKALVAGLRASGADVVRVGLGVRGQFRIAHGRHPGPVRGRGQPPDLLDGPGRARRSLRRRNHTSSVPGHWPAEPK